ncbi:MAG: hypothetical protein ACREJB_08300, partial [Planctomycetaceae bacterium]
MPSLAATAFLKDPDRHELPPVIVLHGAEQHLKQRALDVLVRRTLGDDEEARDVGLTRFTGSQADLKT